MKSQPFPFLGRYHIGWATFWILAILLVFALVTGMDESIRNFPFERMFAFGLFAFFSGWFFSGTHHRSKIIFIGGLFIGLILLMVFNSGADRNLYLAFVNGLRLNRLFKPFDRYFFDLELFIYFFQNSMLNLSNMSKEIFVWILDLIKGQTSYDQNLTEIFWGTFLWSATFSSGWLIRRKNHAFVASLPMMTLLIGILGYTRQKATGLGLAFFALLMMIVVLEHLRYENKWDSNHIDYSDEIRLDIAFLSTPIILAIILVAYVLPNIPFEAIEEFYNRIILVEDQNNIDKYLGLQKTPQNLSSDAASSGVLPRQLLIGSGPELSEKLVMEISTGEVFLPPEINIDSTLPNYYWFGRTFDIYTGSGWKTSEIYIRNYAENEIIASADLKNSRLLNLEIRKASTAPQTLYASGVPQSVDHRVTTGWFEATNEYYSAQIDALEYTVKSPILMVTEENLRQSTGEIPEEILETYLQIPEGTPARINELATSITEDTQSAYDKAKAIESYLRQFEYTLDIPIPNQNQDIVDHFLFDLQKGYCDYFASAMVILSRSIDLPARLAVGYATGYYDYTRQVFVVTEANAHAWPEIYIAPWGWIPFEPTTNQIPILWNESGDYSIPTPEENGAADLENQENPFWINFLILVGMLSLILFTGYLWYKFSYQKPKTIPTNQQISGIYKKMKRHMKSFFISPQPSKTPFEYQKDLINYLNQQKSSKIKSQLINALSENIDTITELYVQGVYSPLPISAVEVKKAKQNLNDLFPRTWILSFFMIFKKSKT